MQKRAPKINTTPGGVTVRIHRKCGAFAASLRRSGHTSSEVLRSLFTLPGPPHKLQHWRGWKGGSGAILKRSTSSVTLPITANGLGTNLIQAVSANECIATTSSGFGPAVM